jgi:PAS domain S-box-containing protein
MFSVLYVDDEPELLEVGKIFLEQDGLLTVNTISSAPAALALPDMEAYDAIVADYQMPEMDGIEFLRNIRKSGNNTPFILFTGRGREEVVIQALNEGADFYLQKGGDPLPQFAELSHKVHQAIQKQEAERRLQESQEQLWTIVDSIQIGIAIIDPYTHRILSMNPKGLEMIGAPAGEVVDHVCHRHICPADAGRCPVTDLGQAVDLSERVLLDSRGRSVPILKSIVPAVIEGKEVLIESFLDISDQKRTEQEIRQQNERLIVISDMEREFAGLSSGERVEEHAAKKLLAISGAVVTTFNVYDRVQQVLRPAAIEVAPGILKSLPDAFSKVAGLVGMDPLKITVPVTPAMYQDIHRSYISTKKSITEMCNGEIPPAVSTAIQKLAAIDRFLLLTHVIDGELYGTSLLGLRADQPDPPMEILDSFAHMVAVSLRRQQAEAAFRESDERLRSFIEQSLDGISIIGNEGRIVEWNLAMEQLTGTPRSEALGRYAWDLAARMVPAGHLQLQVHNRMKALIEEIMQTGTNPMNSPVTYRIARPDGTEVVARQTIFLIQTPHGYLLGTLNQDMTTIERTERGLKESENRFRSLVEYALEAILLLDPKGTVLFANRAAAGLVGAPDPAALAGRNVMEYLAPESHEAAIHDFKQVAQGHDAFLSEYTLVAGPGIRKNVESIGKVISYKGTPSILISLRDITERRKTEDALMMANRQLSLLTGITRHDILNKVSVIRGFLQLAKMKSTDPVIAGFLDRIETETSAIRSQIEFTRVYQDLGTHEPQWMALFDVVPRSSFPPSVSLSMDGKDIRIFADPMLRTVFSNLLDNTIRHGGAQVSAVRVFARPDGKDLIVAWEDNGAGIAATEKERIFERGFGKNTGLGLFLTREILSLTGITIRENGEPGNGARFELNVPNGAYRLAGE